MCTEAGVQFTCKTVQLAKQSVFATSLDRQVDMDGQGARVSRHQGEEGTYRTLLLYTIVQ